MTRKQIINSIGKIKRLLEQSQLLKAIQERNDTEDLLSAMKKVIQHLEKFNEFDRELLKILDLGFLLSDTYWTHIITGQVATLHEMQEPLHSASKYIPRITQFLERNYEYFDDEKYELKKDERIITVILPEEETSNSKPTRIAELMEAVNFFYETCSIIHSENPDELSVISIDSGSDKSFDFLGVAKVVECVKSTIFEIYDRVVFHKEKKHNERLDIIAKSLPIIEKISSLVKEEKMSKEQAEILRRNIFSGTDKFLSVGAILPEFAEYTEVEPRRLMKPEQKLIAERSDSSNGEKDGSLNGGKDNSDKKSENGLTKSEEKQLKKLMAKMNLKDEKEDAD